MLRLSPTVIRVTLSEVKQYERQRKAHDRGGRGKNKVTSQQSSMSSLRRVSLPLRFLPGDILPDQEGTETQRSPTDLEHANDDDNVIIEDSEKMDTSFSNDEDGDDGNETMEDTYEDLIPGLNTPRLPLPLPFSATARVTTSTNHPGTIVQLSRGLRQSEPRRTARLPPEILLPRPTAVFSGQRNPLVMQTSRQAPAHNDDMMNTWQPQTPSNLTEVEHHGRLQPPSPPSIPDPPTRSPRHGERANIPVEGTSLQDIRRIGGTVDLEGTSLDGMNIRRLTDHRQDGPDEIQKLEE
ncbi:hypothetical protein BDP55DRAFT_362190 [Colletotrichum godetiae]|uniref:Uncharacterized protein n=1 Tax=Colletotrichum godetiae TaxID=1209918 RepID=A0AAJ0AA15_9PEZI|nr:uncharacterized protein BDP55DRAFT_362190 [Colletotrichum godetiae]KAK1659308.1 hypothetical protein BDP55DRAFT_362190 [Colletotrichum godetiae]